jgi:hypothetical protein
MKPNITNGAPSWIDDPRNVAQTRQHLRDFNRMDDTTMIARELYDAMLDSIPTPPIGGRRA